MVKTVLVTTYPQAFAAAAAGLLLLPVLLYPLAALAGARAQLTRLLLAPSEGELRERLTEVTRSRARLVVAFEALANVGRHSGASRARVDARHTGERLVVEVHDDGRGGAEPVRGTGPTGLADRLAVLDGTLTVDSPEGAPTMLRVEISCRALSG
ncbi:glucose-6-phosphate-specific signal transduction histidine kinase [Streptomyces sp. V4I23]|nr:glucose-6-phosphate-specific signal transduction histidine kinase [Streptomyces sp. V4I23]